MSDLKCTDLEPVSEEAEVYPSCDSTHAPPSGRSSQGGHTKAEEEEDAEQEAPEADPWYGCEEIANEDMVSFLTDFARLKHYEGAQAWAEEAFLRLDDPDLDESLLPVPTRRPEWSEAGGPLLPLLPGSVGSKKASEVSVRHLRGWGGSEPDRHVEAARTSLQSQSTMTSSGGRSTVRSAYSIGSSSADTGATSPPLWRSAERPLKGWGSPHSTRLLPKMPRGWEPVHQHGSSMSPTRLEDPPAEESGGDGWMSNVWTGLWSLASAPHTERPHKSAE